MARPSQGIDQALLASGQALYPALGCAGLAVRAVAEHAGVNPAMLHYHFGSKEAFVGRVLQLTYDEMYAALPSPAAEGDALERLAATLLALGRAVREHRPFVARVWGDAQQGHAVAREFLRVNAPRHLALLQQLLADAEAQGLLQPAPPLARVMFVMGAVVAPLVIGPGVIELGVAPAAVQRLAPAQVFSDEAIAQRAQMAIAALRAPVPAPRRRSRQGAPA